MLRRHDLSVALISWALHCEELSSFTFLIASDSQECRTALPFSYPCNLVPERCPVQKAREMAVQGCLLVPGISVLLLGSSEQRETFSSPHPCCCGIWEGGLPCSTPGNLLKEVTWVGCDAHLCNLSTQEAEAGGLL